jgi:hypothetical protein
MVNKIKKPPDKMSCSNFCKPIIYGILGPQGKIGKQGEPGPQGPKGTTGSLLYFSESVENVGCVPPGDSSLGENHVFLVSDGNVNPKNILFETDGIGLTFGNFQRSDFETLVKGDQRGSGSVDLSVKRNLCSQVASANFSVIGGGFNNQTSSVAGQTGTTIIGGSDNITHRSYSTIVGGNSNQTYINNFIGSGQSNQTGDISNNIVFGIGSVILSGENNRNGLFTSAGGFFSQYNFIGSGKNNTTLRFTPLVRGPAAGSTFILGENNLSTGSYGLVIGQNQNIDGISCVVAGTNNFLEGNLNFIFGNSNSIVPNQRQTIINGQFNSIGNGANPFNNIICSGNSNFTNGTVSQSSIVNGFENGITGNNQNMLIGNGSNNLILGIITPTQSNSSIINGFQNRINGPSSQSSIYSGNANTVTGNGICIGNGIGNTGSASNVTIGCGTSNIVSVANSFAAGSNLLITTAGVPAAAFGRWNLEGATGATGAVAAAQRIFMIGNGSSSQRANAFSVTNNGVSIAQNAYLTGGADFAEYFYTYQDMNIDKFKTVCIIDESLVGYLDLNQHSITSQDIGKIITYEMLKIIKPETQPYKIFGVISSNASFVGNYHETIVDGLPTNLVKVGLLGQIKILKSQTKHPDWIRMKSISDDMDLWLVL